MKKIFLDQTTDRIKYLIEVSNRTGQIIVCRNPNLTEHYAHKLMLRIPPPISYHTFLNNNKSRNTYTFPYGSNGRYASSYLIDSLEMFFEDISGYSVAAVMVEIEGSNLVII